MNAPIPPRGADAVDTIDVGPASPVSILVVDDNEAKRLALRAVLSPLGHRIVEAAAGTAALRCVMAEQFAVILLDVRMPIMDGFETAALMRQRRESEATPIIFITAFAGDELTAKDRYAEGAADFMFAPVHPEELRAKVSVFATLHLRAEALAARAREVQASADQLRLLTDAAPIGIFQTDAENRYVYTNPRWSEITGVPAAVAAGRAWESIIGADQRGIVASAGYARTGAELTHRFDLRRADAAPRIALVTSRSIPDRCGGVAGWVGTLADVTAETEAEAALANARDEATEATQLKSDFLANMSHEIRTPMNGVLGMTDLLLETDLDPHQRDYAQTVRNSGEALMTIINDILDFSKVEAGMLELEHVEFSVRRVVDDVVSLLARSAQAKGLDLVPVVARSVPALVTGDPGRIRQVLTNLVGNAVKFTQSGEIVVRITEPELLGADAVIRFEVSDTGDGIAADKLDTIFEPFVQADSSTSRKYGGTGLGLAICGQLVALMGGDCGVASRLTRGSKFWFTIRVGAAGREAAGASLADAGFAGVAALIVDASATQLEMLSEYLTDWGIAVTTRSSGAAALATMRSAARDGVPFDVIVLDRSVLGTGLLQNAMATDPTVSVPLILMTGQSDHRESDTIVEPGFCAVLTKPVRGDDLRACLRVALGLWVSDGAPTPVRPSRPDTPLHGQAGRLLLAEDNLINQKVAVAMLSRAGYVVDTVPDGAAAVRAAASHPYDAILMDCQMPNMNGYEATGAIRAREGVHQHTPIIAMTAGARPEDRERCLMEGMDSYLAKPVSSDALLAMLARSIKRPERVGQYGPSTTSEDVRRTAHGFQAISESQPADPV